MKGEYQMKKKIYYIDTALPTTKERVQQYLEKKGLFDGYESKISIPIHSVTPLFAYLRTKPMTKWQMNWLMFRFAFRRGYHNNLDSELQAYYKAAE